MRRLALLAIPLAALAVTATATGGRTAAASCAKGSLATVSSGKLPVGTDNPAYPPWYSGDPAKGSPWKISDPNSGKGFESAVAYAVLGIRPESFEDAAHADPALPTVEVDVAVLEELGSDSHAIFTIDAPRLEAEDLRAAADDEDEALLADDRAVWNARVHARTEARPGSRLKLAVDTSHLYFFDPDSGASLTAGARAAAAIA